MRHKWKKYNMPWELFTQGFVKAEECEHCPCLRFHQKIGNKHIVKFLLNKKWEIKTPECNRNE